MKKITVILLTAVLMATALYGCQNNKENESGQAPSEKKEEDSGDKLSIVASSFPAYDFVRAIGGDEVDLTLLIQPGSESHSFDPSPADMITVEKADVFVYIGGENEEWVDTILDSVDTEDKYIMRLMDYVENLEEEPGIEEEDDHEEENDHDVEEMDEHIWTSPQNAITLIQKIADGMEEASSGEIETYYNNAMEYISQIQEIDEEIKKIVDDSKHKTLVFGDRFPFLYLAKAYGLDYVSAFAGCSTETEASAGTVARLIDHIRDNDLSYVYYIELSNENIANAIAEETGAETLELHSCQNVTVEEFEAGETYVSIMKKNVESLRKGLN